MVCGRFMLTLDSVKYLLTHHTSQHLPFLDLVENTKSRTTFYKTLTRLVFLGDYHTLLMPFMEPILNVLVQLRSTTDYNNENVRRALIGACRDLRGVLQSSANKRTYILLFDCLNPAYMQVFKHGLEAWYHDPAVTSPLLKFIAELCSNKSQRINFGQSSANGILLFREASSLICTYGAKIAQMPTHTDASTIYKMRYKGISLALDIMSSSLIGSYVNFGVFKLYGDPALQMPCKSPLTCYCRFLSAKLWRTQK